MNRRSLISVAIRSLNTEKSIDEAIDTLIVQVRSHHREVPEHVQTMRGIDYAGRFDCGPEAVICVCMI